jgi:cytoskeletal protein CcmA (bactofilin family)
MLRMGRSPKVDSNEARPLNTAPPMPQTAPPQQHAQAHTTSPPAQTFEPHAARHVPPAPAVVAQPSAPRAVTESEALARDLREGIVSGFIGSGTVVSGDAEFKGMLRIDGHFTGRVRSEKGSLIVSAGGVVDANIEVAAAKINGTVNGDIVATGRVEFGRSARVRGQLQTPALVIEEGAIFEGSCRMQQTKPEAAKAPKVEEPKVEEARTASALPKQAPAKSAQSQAATTTPANVGATSAAAVPTS